MSGDAPLVISGLGGSGTRVPAAMCRVLGLDMGQDRNSADDDLLFTLLMKRRPLLRGALDGSGDAAVLESLEAYARLRGRGPHSGGRALRQALWASRAMVRTGIERRSAPRRALWTVRRVASVRLRSANGPWGFKEPTAHLYLPHLLRRWPGLRYVHVVRSPQDYAVKPHNQFLLWGPLLGIPVPERREDLAAAQLRYWAVANARAVRLARQAGVLACVVRLEDAMTGPARAAAQLASSLGAAPSDGVLRAMAAVAVEHPSRGRGADLDLEQLLPEEELSVVRSFGYGGDRGPENA